MSIPTNKNIKAVAYNGVNIPLAGTTPTGKITITGNGTDIDIAQYALADVNVSGGSPDVKMWDIILPADTNASSITIAEFDQWAYDRKDDQNLVGVLYADAMFDFRTTDVKVYCSSIHFNKVKSFPYLPNATEGCCAVSIAEKNESTSTWTSYYPINAVSLRDPNTFYITSSGGIVMTGGRSGGYTWKAGTYHLVMWVR